MTLPGRCAPPRLCQDLLTKFPKPSHVLSTPCTFQYNQVAYVFHQHSQIHNIFPKYNHADNFSSSKCSHANHVYLLPNLDQKQSYQNILFDLVPNSSCFTLYIFLVSTFHVLNFVPSWLFHNIRFVLSRTFHIVNISLYYLFKFAICQEPKYSCV